MLVHFCFDEKLFKLMRSKFKEIFMQNNAIFVYHYNKALRQDKRACREEEVINDEGQREGQIFFENLFITTIMLSACFDILQTDTLSRINWSIFFHHFTR